MWDFCTSISRNFIKVDFRIRGTFKTVLESATLWCNVWMMKKQTKHYLNQYWLNCHQNKCLLPPFIGYLLLVVSVQSLPQSREESAILNKLSKYWSSIQIGWTILKVKLNLDFDRYPVWYRYQVPIPGVCICIKKIGMNPVSVSVSVRYRYDFWDIGICLNILLTDISVSIYRYRSNSTGGIQMGCGLNPMLTVTGLTTQTIMP